MNEARHVDGKFSIETSFPKRSFAHEIHIHVSMNESNHMLETESIWWNCGGNIQLNVMQSLCEWRLVIRLFWVCQALEWPRNVRENQRYTCENVQNIDDATSALAAAVAAVHGGEHSTECFYTACRLCVCWYV